MLKLIEAGLFERDRLGNRGSRPWNPGASIEANDLIIILAMSGPSYESAVRLAGGMKTAGSHVWILTDQPWKGAAVDAITYLPVGQPELFMPLYAIIPFYQFAYFTALAKGHSPDAMRMDVPSRLEARTQMRSTLS